MLPSEAVPDWQQLRPHPLALLIPPMAADEYALLVEDLAQHGLHEPITLYEGKILDGRHRLRAILELGRRGVTLEPHFRPFTGGEGEALAYVWSLNFHRRHLTYEQKVCLGVELKRRIQEQVRPGAPRGNQNAARDNSGNPASIVSSEAAEGALRAPQARDLAARLVSVSGRAIDKAQSIQTAAPDLFVAVRSGGLTLWEADREMRRREQQERETSLVVPPLPSAQGPFAVLYADPPWEYEANSTDPTRQIANHYPTLSLDAICALPIGELAAENSVLFLWATSPKLAEAVQVLTAWGFSYRTCWVWVKDRIGMGYYVRQQHELLLIGVRGSLPVPAPEHRPPSVLTAPRREHSRKPEEFAVWIERMYPGLSRVELFCRGPVRAGWSTWGSEG